MGRPVCGDVDNLVDNMWVSGYLVIQVDKRD
jgi:hypothetical protein